MFCVERLSGSVLQLVVVGLHLWFTSFGSSSLRTQNVVALSWQRSEVDSRNMSVMATQGQLAVRMQQTMQTSHLAAPVHQLAQVPQAQQAQQTGGATAFGFRLSAVWLSAFGRCRPASSFPQFGILTFWSDMRGAENNRCSDRLEPVREE